MILWGSIKYFYVVVVILFPEEYNTIHSIHTTFQQFHKCIPLEYVRSTVEHKLDSHAFFNFGYGM